MERLYCIVDGARSGALNMAYDEVMLESVAQGRRSAALRFYLWSPPCLSLGYFQKSLDGIDVTAARRAGVHILRRPTGGRAVLHDREITYSLAMAAHLSIPESFKSVNEALLCGLSLLGVDADLIPRSRGGSTARNPICFLSPSWYEIAWRGRKLLGSAQTRRGPWMLQHGSLPLTIDRPFLLSLFREGSRYSDDAIDNMASLSESQARTISSDHVIEALQEGFRRTFARDLLPDEWTQEEAGHAETLAYERYPLL